MNRDEADRSRRDLALILTGPPAAGKTTVRRHLTPLFERTGVAVLSTEDVVAKLVSSNVLAGCAEVDERSGAVLFTDVAAP